MPLSSRPTKVSVRINSDWRQGAVGERWQLLQPRVLELRPFDSVPLN